MNKFLGKYYTIDLKGVKTILEFKQFIFYIEHAFLNDLGRADYVSVTDDEALAAFRMLTEMEGIIPALESAHAIAHLLKLAPELSAEQVILVCLSGRGDKDIHTVAEAMGVEL